MGVLRGSRQRGGRQQGCCLLADPAAPCARARHCAGLAAAWLLARSLSYALNFGLSRPASMLPRSSPTKRSTSSTCSIVRSPRSSRSWATDRTTTLPAAGRAAARSGRGGGQRPAVAGLPGATDLYGGNTHGQPDGSLIFFELSSAGPATQRCAPNRDVSIVSVCSQGPLTLTRLRQRRIPAREQNAR